jgi:hypothetical protein
MFGPRPCPHLARFYLDTHRTVTYLCLVRTKKPSPAASAAAREMLKARYSKMTKAERVASATLASRAAAAARTARAQARKAALLTDEPELVEA